MKSAVFVALAGAALVAPAADATINIYVSQSGDNVLAETIGTFDLTGLTYSGQFTNSPSIRGYWGVVDTGTYGALVNRYTGLTGATDHFNNESSATPNHTTFVGSGTAFGFNLVNFTVLVAAGYGGEFIDSTAIFSTPFVPTTLTTLDLVAGTYVVNAPHDTITIHIGEAAPAAVPEPATWAMFIGGFGAIGAAMRRRQRATVRFA